MNCWTKDGLTRFGHYMQPMDEELNLAKNLFKMKGFDANMRDINGRYSNIFSSLVYLPYQPSFSPTSGLPSTT